MKSIAKFAEGTIFSVPLEGRGISAIGVLARTNRKGSAFGYFFRPSSRLEDLNWHDSVLAVRFGDHGLATGRWVVLGSVLKWDRLEWPLPEFARETDDPSLRVVTRYNDKLEAVSERVVPTDSLSPKCALDVQFGSAVIERMLLSRL